MQKELEEEKIERAKEEVSRRLKSIKSLRAFCVETGGSSEVCDKISSQDFESFEAEKAYCLGLGGPSEVCAVFEPNCRKAGLTIANECFLDFLQGP